jgi:hypothetical protein
MLKLNAVIQNAQVGSTLRQVKVLGVEEVVKSADARRGVIPAKAWIQSYQSVLDSGVRRNDAAAHFLTSLPVLTNSQKVRSDVTPAEAGVQNSRNKGPT